MKIEETFYGIQQADHDLLRGIVSMLHPKTVVEIGYGLGYSARAILETLPEDGRLYSFDPNPNLEVKTIDRRFYLERIAGENVLWSEMREEIDFLFLDASHEYESNKKIFENFYPHLSYKAVVAVHDTGPWSKIHNPDVSDGKWEGDKYFHRPEEKDFVEWAETLGFERIDFWTLRTMRHGITLLQET